MKNLRTQLLDPLIGHRLNAVQFVMDYVQFHFDADRLVLTAITWPSVQVEGVVLRQGDLGYCDRLVGRIGRKVPVATVSEGEEVRLEFDDNSVVCISLHPKDYYGPEAVTLVSGDDWWIW